MAAEQFIDFAKTPEGLIILAVAAFVLVTFAITALIFIVAGFLRRRFRKPLADATGDATDPLATAPAPDAQSSDDARDPLESFDRRALKAPIALARLRAMGPDITRAAEPRFTEAAAPEPAPSGRTEPVVAAPSRSAAAPASPDAAESACTACAPVDAVSGAAPVVPPMPPEQTPQPQQPLPPVQRTEPPVVVLVQPAPAVTPMQPGAVPVQLDAAYAAAQNVQPAPAVHPAAAPAFSRSPAPDPFANAEILLTLPFERRPGLAMAHADLCGAAVEAVFFDPEPVSRWDEEALRLVPFLPSGAARLLVTESDRETFRAGALHAQPDSVLELPGGLIALEYKSKGGRLEDPLRWAEALRTKDLLQTVLNALALSAESGRPAAPVLRTQNAVFFIRPTLALKQALTENLDGAAAFLTTSSEGAAPAGISASDYAELMTPAVHKLFPRPQGAGSAYGRAAHDALLARR